VRSIKLLGNYYDSSKPGDLQVQVLPEGVDGRSVNPQVVGNDLPAAQAIDNYLGDLIRDRVDSVEHSSSGLGLIDGDKLSASLSGAGFQVPPSLGQLGLGSPALAQQFRQTVQSYPSNLPRQTLDQ